MTLEASGYIGWGDVDSFGVVLDRDTEYEIHVEPDAPDVDFDLFIYDENDNLIAYDEATDPDAHAAVTPKWTGPFNIFVKAASGGGGYTITVIDLG